MEQILPSPLCKGGLGGFWPLVVVTGMAIILIASSYDLPVGLIWQIGQGVSCKSGSSNLPDCITL